MLLAAPGCESDNVEQCNEAYEHLLQIGKRTQEFELQRRFVTACVAAFDTGRIECLLKATTSAEANACKPKKKRPG